jgi:mono/diheme cytochrome c family protein
MKKIVLSAIIFASSIFAASPALDSLNAEYAAEVKKTNPSFKNFSAEKGKQIYFAVQQDKNGQPINCATCHTDNLKNSGKNATTGKIIEPLAPSVNKIRLTDRAEIEKWLTRNFKQVYGRVGTAQEKGDVLAFIAQQ